MNAPRSLVGISLRFTRTSPLGAASAGVLIFLGLVAIFANQLAPNDPLEVFPEYFRNSPTWERPFGSDHIGRDTFSRVIVGLRTSLYVAFVSVALSKLIGFSWGILSGYLGGKFDLISQRFLDVLLSFPGLILALLLLVAMGGSLYTVIVAIAATGIAGTTRVIRSVALSVREMHLCGGGPCCGCPLSCASWFFMWRTQCIAHLMVVVSLSH